MKTTINISNTLFEQTRRFASKQGSTFKEVVEGALRLFLKSHSKPQASFKLKKHTFKGEGFAPEFAENNWSKIREHIYEGRGG